MQPDNPEDQRSATEIARTGGNDAVCFTAGPTGAAFAAGVIHAYLAIDRKQPLVATGISFGAISAAAMRRVYQELEDGRPLSLEQKRWSWFRRYLNAVTNNPLRSLWNSLPDPVDFSATTSPVTDNSVPPNLKLESEEARRHYHILTKLGVWLANLPIRVSTVATIAVMTVRKKERYGTWLDRCLYWWNCSKLLAGLWWHVIRSPSFFNEGEYDTRHRRRSRRNLFGTTRIRPLFGEAWWIFLVLGPLGIVFATAPIIVLTFLWRLLYVRPAYLVLFFLLLILEFVLAIVMAGPLVFSGMERFAGASLGEVVLSWLMKRVDVDQALLHSYEANRQLHDLFVEQAPESVREPEETDVRLLIVCAALERTEQVCLRHEMNVADALMAAIAVPGLFKPKVVSSNDVYPSQGHPQTSWEYLSLIDGAAVRANPLLAFFEYCKHKEHREIALKFEGTPEQPPSLHVVYSVPLDYPKSLQSAPPLECPDIVQSAKLGLDLEKRRDTRQEVRQVQYTSELECIRRKLRGKNEPEARGPFTIFPDEIAPIMVIDEADQPDFSRERSMAATAEGCRTTLETLYRKEIQTLGNGAGVACTQLLAAYGGRRESSVGLPEVCATCTKQLSFRPVRPIDEAPAGLYQSFGASEPSKEYLRREFNHLAKRGNIVFLGSGGVFRGAFHVGVIAAMAVTHLYPDLVVGASVGTLMGGALCRITAGEERREIEVLESLANIFLDVDTNVALTKVLKNAAKQLGIRARAISLSPAELSRMVRRGSQSDPGFAATGAPPALIDAISYLFAIPHQTTKNIASEFVAGHITASVHKFLTALRSDSLSALEIRSFLMGTSLLEQQVRDLLGEGAPGVNLSAVQPYHHPVRKKVSYFGTTSFLNAGVSMLLGRDFLTLNPSWDAANMGLSSSAFPTVFPPRTEADLLPGRGSTSRYFADGGLFDNLPFLPAIEILSAVQASNTETSAKGIQETLQCLTKVPNLLISAGLNAIPSNGGTYSNILRIKSRASTLGFKSKTDSFTKGSQRTLNDLRDIAQRDWGQLNSRELEFLKKSVPSTVLPIWPSSEDHLNGTFAFCRSLGLNANVIQRSIGDGCFQTLEAVRKEPTVDSYLCEENRISISPEAEKEPAKGPSLCPFFHRGGSSFPCPFAASDVTSVKEIRDKCASDQMHRRARTSI